MLLDPPALKTKSHGASEAAKRMIEHQLAPNRRANNLASKKKEPQSDLRDVLEKKRKKPEAKNGRDDGPSNKRQRSDDGPGLHGPHFTNCTITITNMSINN